MNKLVEISKSLHDTIAKYSKTLVKRNRKVSLHDAFAFNCMYTFKNSSQINIQAKMNYNSNKNVSIRAMLKRSDVIPESMVNEVIELFNNKDFNKKEQKFAIDGSKFNLTKDLISKGYKPNPKKQSVTVCTMGIFNISSNLPEALKLSKSHNERKAVIEFLDMVEDKYKDCIFIFDRGYYSLNMISELRKRKIHYIFRIKEDSKFIPDNIKIQENAEAIVFNNNRIVKYSIGTKSFYMLTDLKEKDYPLDTIKQMYHERWQIEESFKFQKNSLKLDEIPLRNSDRIEKLMPYFLLVSKIVYFIQNLYQAKESKCKDKKYVINKSLLVDGLFQTDFLLRFIYNDRFETVLKQFENAYIKVTHTQKGKSYKIVCVNTIFKSYRKFSETKNKKPKKEKEKIDKT